MRYVTAFCAFLSSSASDVRQCVLCVSSAICASAVRSVRQQCVCCARTDRAKDFDCRLHPKHKFKDVVALASKPNQALCNSTIFQLSLQLTSTLRKTSFIPKPPLSNMMGEIPHALEIIQSGSRKAGLRAEFASQECIQPAANEPPTPTNLDRSPFD